MNFVVSGKASMSVYEGFGLETNQIHCYSLPHAHKAPWRSSEGMDI